MKKKVKITLIIVLLLLIVGTSGGVYYFFFKPEERKEVKVEHKIKGYGYILKDSKSKQYKKLFYKCS